MAQDYNNEDEDYRVVERKYWDCLGQSKILIRPPCTEQSNITYLDIAIQICKLNVVIHTKIFIPAHEGNINILSLSGKYDLFSS